jgi:hypothetical protein
LKRFSIPTQALVITLIISACSVKLVPQTTPTIDPVSLQVTAIIAASTIVAETQAAIPTATPPIPPTATVTNTPNVTTTLPPLPTLGATFTPSPVGDSGVGDPCINKELPDSLTGETIKIRIDNPTTGTINVSVYLQQSRPQGVCGYRAYALAPQDTLVINDLIVGCYTLWAWNPEPKDYFMVTNGTNCLDTSQNWTFDIVPNDSIKLR